jgi:flagellar biosynthesis protein FliR
MKSKIILRSIKTGLCLLSFAVVIVACDNQQGMMHGSGGSTYMGNWNWIQILIGIILGFLLGYLFARRRK